MAQADIDRITSRRNFLVGSALASAAIVTPLAVMAASPSAGSTSKELLDLSVELIASHEALMAYCREVDALGKGTSEFSAAMRRHLPIAQRHRYAVDAVESFEAKNRSDLEFKAELAIDADGDGSNRIALSLAYDLINLASMQRLA